MSAKGFCLERSFGMEGGEVRTKLLAFKHTHFSSKQIGQSGDTGAKGALPWACNGEHSPWVLLILFPSPPYSFFYFKFDPPHTPLFNILGTVKDPFY
jgi:hypothetical protein